jgi:hypothetical protein
MLYLLLSCSNESEEMVICMAPEFSQNIVGTWNVLVLETNQSSSVTFRDDATGTNNMEVGPFIYYCRLNDENIFDFSWRIDIFDGIENLFLRYKNTNCTQDNGHLILVNDCERIELSSGLETFILTKG